MNTKEYSICFRDFEERDIDFVLKCKNDDSLNEMIVGTSRKFTFEDAKKWLEGCMGDHETYKFWAVCTNDIEKRIVGWISLSQIDRDNHCACHHGIVIGDKDYRDGTVMFEAMLLSMDYAFNILHLHRLYGSCLSEHKTSPHMLNSLGFNLEGTQKDAVYRNGRYYDVLDYAMLNEEYLRLDKNNVFEIDQLIMGFVNSLKTTKYK
jgi:RimJ/RimL family protein N-acetyltransferase